MGEQERIRLIRNGRIVTPDATVQGELLVRGEKIVEIGPAIAAGGAEIIDAKNCYVLPGGIDVHTHFNLDIGTAVAQDDFHSGTVAAAMGGTTTIVDHPGFGPQGCSLFHQIDKYHQYALGNAVIDYSFHGVVQHIDDKVAKEIPKLIAHGITSAKIYMTYDFMFTGTLLQRVLQAAAEHGLLIAVHAEDDGLIRKLKNDFIAKRCREPIYHAKSRPVRTEAEAVKEVIEAAKKAGDAALYIVHLSTGDGLDIIKKARSEGQRIFTETCPQYLLLDEDRYNEPELHGLKYVMSPPLRSRSHLQTLWGGLAEGSIDVVATDHCPFDFALKKELAAEDFSKCPGGIPGVEARLPLLFSEGVSARGFPLQWFAKVTAENPAKIMGLYPAKGRLAPGADADIVIIDPDKKVHLSRRMLHENVDYTPYENFTLQGWPTLTMVRGTVVARDGRFVGSKGFGRFIKRKTYVGEHIGQFTT